VIVALFPPFPTVVVPAVARRIAAQMHLGAVAIDVRDDTARRPARCPDARRAILLEMVSSSRSRLVRATPHG
jgi:hypothetical protein